MVGFSGNSVWKFLAEITEQKFRSRTEVLQAGWASPEWRDSVSHRAEKLFNAFEYIFLCISKYILLF